MVSSLRDGAGSDDRISTATPLRGAAGRRASALAMVLSLSACATLPTSGPTGHQVFRAAANPAVTPAFTIVEVDSMANVPATGALAPLEVNSVLPPPTDLIGPGDVLDIEIYEAGVTLFAGSRSAASAATTSAAGGAAQAEHLPATRVDDSGDIFVPFAGRMRAAGHTAAEVSGMIRRALKGMSQDPQVLVTIGQSITNSVIVGGEVGRPGRLVLNTNRETLSDVIALAGGYRGDAKDVVVQVTRGSRRFEYRLADVMSGPERDMRVSPTDRVELVKRPMTFAVMGGAGKVEQMAFSAPAVNLAEGLALAGGAHPYMGDAKAVFVFRFIKGPDGKEQPTVYHINMMNAGSYFLAERFAMRDKDLLYVGNAAANQPSKLIQLVSQMFSPIVAVESVLVNTGTVK